jgi:hypothetical protein
MLEASLMGEAYIVEYTKHRLVGVDDLAEDTVMNSDEEVEVDYR